MSFMACIIICPPSLSRLLSMVSSEAHRNWLQTWFQKEECLKGNILERFCGTDRIYARLFNMFRQNIFDMAHAEYFK